MDIQFHWDFNSEFITKITHGTNVNRIILSLTISIKKIYFKISISNLFVLKFIYTKVKIKKKKKRDKLKY